MPRRRSFYRPNPVDAAPIGNTPGARLWYLLTTHVPRLIRANFICVVFCLPVITIPAALCALHAVVLQYYRIGYGDVWPSFWKEFWQNFWQKTLVSMLLLALPFGGWFLGGMFAEWASYVGAAILAVFGLCVLAWLYPQLALLKLPFWTALQNAALLMAIETWKNLWILLILLITAGLMILAWPLSALLFLFLIPVLPVVLLTAVTQPVLDERLVQPESEGMQTREENP